MYNMMHSQCMIANLKGDRSTPPPTFHYAVSATTRLLLTLLRGPLPSAVRHQPRNLDFPEPKFWEG